MNTRTTIFCILVAVLAIMTAGMSQASVSPADIAGMSFWFSPATLNDAISNPLGYTNGQAVTVWDNINNAATVAAGTSTRDATGSGSSAPTYLNAANGISGHAAVHFDGVNDFLATIESGIGDSNTVFVVFRTTSTDAVKDDPINPAQTLLGNDNGSTVVWSMGVTGGKTEFNGYGPYTSITGTNVSDGGAHFFSVQMDINNITLSTDGGPTTSGTVPGFITGLKRFKSIGAGYLSGLGTHGDLFTGDIAEIIVYNRVLTATEFNQINQYLTDTYIVPEPATLILLVTGAVLIASRRRKQTSC